MWHSLWRHPHLPHWQILLSAILFVLSTPPFQQSYLVFIAWIPWLLLLKSNSSFRYKFIQSAWLASLITFGSFYWIAYAIPTFGGLPLWVGLFALLLFSFICQLQIPLFSLVHQVGIQNRQPLSQRRPFWWAILASAFYVALDFTVPKLFKDSIGHHLFNWVMIRQIAEYTGVPGLTFLVFLINYSISQALHEFFQFESLKGAFCLRGFTRLLIKRGIWGVLLFGFATLCGSLRYHSVENRTAQRTLRGAAIQANIGDIEKIAAETGHRGAADRVINTYLELSESAHREGIDFLVWPETAFPSTFGSPRSLEEMGRERRVFEWVRNHKTPLLFGGYDTEKGRDFNAFFFLEPEKNTIQSYRKTLLLPFGEFMPGAEQFEFIRDSFPTVGNFGRGNGPQTYFVDSLKDGQPTPFSFIPAICYEILYPVFISDGYRKAPTTQFILNITNDSWFGNFGEPQSHLALSTFRAIETRLPVLRVTNTGISALILPDGTIEAPTEIGEKLYRIYSIPIFDKPLASTGSWFIRIGPWPYFVSLLGTVFYLFWLLVTGRRGGVFPQKQ